MKKFTTFALIILALFSGVIFSACGDKYKNLKMEFVYTDGTTVEELVLIKDVNNPGLAKKRIGVKFTGVDKDDIGQVVVYSSPSELFTVSNEVYSEGYYYCDITATRASTGKLIVKHLSSNKTEEVDLRIEQKSTDLIGTTKKYVVAVNDVEPGSVRTHMLKTKELINLVPSTSTDKVYFKEVFGASVTPAGVNKIIETIDGVEYIVGFQVMDFAVPQTHSYKLVPVTKMEGYSDKIYDDERNNDYEIVEIFFANVLNANNVYLDTDDKHKDAEGKIYETIYLIANDVSADESDNYNYNNVLFDLKTTDEGVLGRIADHLDYYDISIVEDSSAIQATHTGNGKCVVQATAYTEGTVNVDFVITPKNLIGDVQEIRKTIVVKGEVRSDTIETKKKDEVIDINNPIDIYNYIAVGNSNGVKFGFEALANSGISVFYGLNKLRVEIYPEILYLEAENGYYKNILDADGQRIPDTATVVGDVAFGERYLANQKNLIRIFRGNDYLQFQYDKLSNKFISTSFMSFSELFIKYVETSNVNDDVELSMDVTAGYEGDLNYLKDISKTRISLKFETKEGVSALNLFAGSYKINGGTIEHSPVQNVDKTEYIAATNLYINKDAVVIGENEYELIFTQDSVFGLDNRKVLSNIELDVEINFVAQHITKPIMFGGGVGYKLTIENLATNKYLPIEIDSDTSVGEYKIVFKQKDTGFEKVINCYIYKDLSIADHVSLDFAQEDLNNEAFKNFYHDDLDKKYTYEDYEADYIVYVGKTLTLSANINAEVLNSNIIKGYSYNPYMMNSAKEETTEITWNNYFSYTTSEMGSNISQLDFINNGLINDGNVYYLAYEIAIETKKFVNILQEDVGNSNINKTVLTFFVYERIVDEDETKATINTPVLEKYMSDYIGYNNLSESIAELTVVMDEEKLWNYVQPQDGKSNSVEWKHSFGDRNNIVELSNVQDKSVTAKFKKHGDNTSYNCYIIAEIRQFNKIISLRCEVLVKKPILTEALKLTNTLPRFEKMSSNAYFKNSIFEYNLDMRQNDDFVVTAEHVSSLGDVTHKGISLVVANAQGSTIQDAITIDGNKIVVDRIQSGLRLIVYSTDVLNANVEDYVSGFKQPADYIMEGENPNEWMYKKAYFIINLHLEDGLTKETAYRVYNLADFEEMLSSKETGKWYQIMNDINLSGLNVFNKDFDGHIYSDYGCMFYNLKLTKANKNLFKTLNGSIENLKFDLNYNYILDGNQTEKENLGLIGEFTTGSYLKDVVATIGGSAEFKNENHLYDFGMLIGSNFGAIEYGEDICAVKGSVSLTGKAGVNFGGLVGVNNGIIKGANVNETDLTVVDAKISFSSGSGMQGAIADLVISATNFEMENGSLGGFVGKNCGNLTGVYIVGQIIAPKVSNVGGVIGYSQSVETGNYTRDPSTNAISYNATEIPLVENVKSSVVITAKDNVGGVVGYDEFGLYKQCWYQILPTTDIAIKANEKVGGIVGYSKHSKLQFCSVFSYKYNYSDVDKCILDLQTSNADIQGLNYVAGLIGFVHESTLEADTVDVTSATIVRNSSVNASIKATGEAGAIYTSADATINGIIYSSYFVGKLVGEFDDDLCLDNVNASANNLVYTMNLQSTSFVEASNGIDKTIVIPYWNKLDGVNLNYIYVSSDETENKPIFDLVPNSFDVQSKLDASKNINVYYYDFSTSGATEEEIKHLNSEFNQVKILDLLNFIYAPGGDIMVAVKSSDTNIIDIVGDKLIVLSLGEATLTFNPVLNTKLVCEITVKVSDNLSELVVTQDGRTALQELRVAKENTKQIQTYSVGYVDATYYPGLGKVYNYKSTNKYSLMLYIKWTAEAKNKDYYKENSKISHYVKVNNGNIKVDEADLLQIFLPYGTPLSFTADNVGGEFEVEIKPFINETDAYIVDEESKFTLLTCQGASAIAFNYNYAIVYPNDVTNLTLTITTDIELGEDEIKSLIYSVILNKNNQAIEEYISLFEIKEFNSDKNEQIAIFKVAIDSKFELIEEPAELNINFKTEYSAVQTVDFTILPQRIDKIEAKSYVYTDFKNAEIITTNVLKPNQLGLLVIDVSPNNGYYDYLEIDDVTGNEEIKFIQLESVNGNSLFEVDTPSTFGKGIKLVKLDRDSDNKADTIYVTMQIDKNFSSKMHTLRINAYFKDGTVLKTDYKQIDVKMLPIINVEYQLPNGESKHYETNNAGLEEVVTDLYFANGTSAEFRITTANTTEPLDYSILSGAYNGQFEFVNTHGDFYILNNKEINNNDINKEISIRLQATSILNNNIETAILTLKFKIVPYVIHSVSMTSTNSKDEVFGNFGVVTDLDAYFKETDISYYNNGTYHDTVYTYNNELTDILPGDDYETKTRKSINNILKELNTNAENNYLIVNSGINGDYSRGITQSGENELTKRYQLLESDDITLKYNPNKMIVTSNYPENAHLALDMELIYDDISMIWNVQSNITTGSIDVSKNYKLNFNRPFEEDDYLLVKDVNDFLAMEDGLQNHYILGNDLVLEDYAPIDVNIAEFDGNGRTITIKSFAMFTEQVINAGLFKQIYPNMLVKNVNVVYQSTPKDTIYSFGKVKAKGGSNSVVDFDVEYADICNDYTVNYTQATFGGLTPINNGIITNCTASGEIALRASTVEINKTASTGGNYEIAFNIGGLVGENTKTGYITNSVSELKIFALANVGGFVYSNEGKIASCSVEEQAVIYSYNINLEKTILVEVGGFVSQNKGEISMSHTTMNYFYNGGKTYKGFMSTKDESAGFVYENTGSIKNSFVQISKLGNHNNIFCGFVYANKGKIQNAYTSINQGVDAGANAYMFVQAGATNLIDCLEFVKITSGYEKDSSDGLKTEDYNKILSNSKEVKEIFQNSNYIFGTGNSAVWSMENASLPFLVSCEEKVRYTLGQSSSGNNYYGLRNISYVQTSIENQDGSTSFEWKVEFVEDTYGKKENPYIIANLNNWNTRLYNNTTGYYRVVADIEFSEFNNPSTSVITFSGNLQGNDMVLSNIKLYLQEDVEGIGLFKSLQTAEDFKIDNSVRNLSLEITSGWASKADAFGVFAGKAVGFNLYNIAVNAADVTIVGGNAVGGVVGYVGGEFDIDGISSNVGVNSTRELSSYRYNIYAGKNNKLTSNLQSVYYAGSVFGVVDGYNKSFYNASAARDLEDKYYLINHITVEDNPILIGDTVGAAFGFVGERVKVTNVNVNLQGAQFKGYQYSAGLAGENRGIIDGATVIISGESFIETNYAAAGVVGLNVGGLLRNVKVNTQIIKTGTTVVGGVVARNIAGVIADVEFEGVVQSRNITGVIMATNYSKETFEENTGASSITNVNNLDLIVPDVSTFKYVENGNEIEFENLTIHETTLQHFFNNITSFYTFSMKKVQGKNEISQNNLRAFGLFVGMTDNENSLIDSIRYQDGKQIVLNPTSGSNYVEKPVGVDLPSGEVLIKLATDKYYMKEDGSFTDNVLDAGVIRTFEKTVNFAYRIYITGVKVETFDNWDKVSFTNDFVVFGNFVPDED